MRLISPTSPVRDFVSPHPFPHACRQCVKSFATSTAPTRSTMTVSSSWISTPYHHWIRQRMYHCPSQMRLTSITSPVRESFRNIHPHHRMRLTLRHACVKYFAASTRRRPSRSRNAPDRLLSAYSPQRAPNESICHAVRYCSTAMCVDAGTAWAN